MIISLSGHISSGKDTSGLYIQEKLINLTNQSFIIMKFADALKQMVSIVLDIPVRELENSNIKNMYLPLWGKTVREFMYEFATDCCRKYNPDFWLNILRNKYDPQKSNWIITDMRFPNEYNWIQKENGWLIRIDRPNVPVIDHISETALDYFEFPYLIYNNYDYTNLYNQLDLVINDILIKEYNQ